MKSYPDLNVAYARKAQELRADYVFVLDKPLLSREFVSEIDGMHLPMVWIDHHALGKPEFLKEYSSVHLYNPAYNAGKQKSTEPVTYQLYETLQRSEDLWIAIMGCVADHYLPAFAKEFAERYAEYWSSGVKEPFDAYYGTEIGKIAQALSFGLKDSISHVVTMQNFLAACKGPDEVFLEMESNKSLRERVVDIRRKYEALLASARAQPSGKLLFFEYAGDLSISADLANELCYHYPQKYIAVAYRKGGVANMSLRGKNIKKVLAHVLTSFEGATGGGHNDAVGARLRADDVPRFRSALAEALGAEHA